MNPISPELLAMDILLMEKGAGGGGGQNMKGKS